MNGGSHDNAESNVQRISLGNAWVMGLLCLGVLSGCQSTSTNFDFDDRVDFRRYQTFSWISENPLSFHTMESHASTLLEERLMESARTSFAGKGLRYVEDPAEADLLVSFSVGSRERIISRDFYDSNIGGYYGGDYYGGYGYGYGGSSYWASNSRRLGSIYKGQVCVDLFDRQAKRPVWHGTARETVKKPDVEYWRDSVDRIVSLIVAGYPATDRD
jgi:uncharacterized protein DUF4136